MFDTSMDSLYLDRYRIFSIFLGTILGVLYFFDSNSFGGFIGGVLFVVCIFLGLTIISQLIRSQKYFKVFKVSLIILPLASVFLIVALSGQMVVASCTATPGYEIEYNSLTGECEINGYYCEVEQARPWYIESCEGKNLENFCSEQEIIDKPVDDRDDFLKAYRVNETCK